MCTYDPVQHVTTPCDFERQGLDVMRIPRVGSLDALDPHGIACEACGGRMPEHAWADMDEYGFVVRCSNQRDLLEIENEAWRIIGVMRERGITLHGVVTGRMTTSGNSLEDVERER